MKFRKWRMWDRICCVVAVFRFCIMIAREATRRRFLIERILYCLEKRKIRCTYDAVAQILTEKMGDKYSPIVVGTYLAKRRCRASWVVRKSTEEPTGYTPEQKHPDLYSNPKVIKSKTELKAVCGFK